jgi:hypothetical protein
MATLSRSGPNETGQFVRAAISLRSPSRARWPPAPLNWKSRSGAPIVWRLRRSDRRMGHRAIPPTAMG